MDVAIKDVDITFGIPMYNAEPYIGELLRCFDINSNVNYEILIVDDGSTDKSFEICEELRNPKLRVIRKKNQGVSLARNQIIENAKGKWITFIDADDLIVFNSYIEAFNLLVDGDFEFLINSKKFDLSELIEREIINSPCMKFYNSEILRKNGIVFRKEVSIGEDLIFNLEYYRCVKKILFYNKELYKYRKINNNSLTSKYRKNKFEELMHVNEICKDMFDDVKIMKSFEYIRIKNCFSCIKSHLYFENVKDVCTLIARMKQYSKKKYLILNNHRTSLVYLAWYMFPNAFLAWLVKWILKFLNLDRKRN